MANESIKRDLFFISCDDVIILRDVCVRQPF
jgi:hypothetical protein